MFHRSQKLFEKYAWYVLKLVLVQYLVLVQQCVVLVGQYLVLVRQYRPSFSGCIWNQYIRKHNIWRISTHLKTRLGCDNSVYVRQTCWNIWPINNFDDALSIIQDYYNFETLIIANNLKTLYSTALVLIIELVNFLTFAKTETVWCLENSHM